MPKVYLRVHDEAVSITPKKGITHIGNSVYQIDKNGGEIYLSSLDLVPKDSITWHNYIQECPTTRVGYYGNVGNIYVNNNDLILINAYLYNKISIFYTTGSSRTILNNRKYELVLGPNDGTIDRVEAYKEYPGGNYDVDCLKPPSKRDVENKNFYDFTVICADYDKYFGSYWVFTFGKNAPKPVSLYFPHDDYTKIIYGDSYLAPAYPWERKVILYYPGGKITVDLPRCDAYNNGQQ